MAKIACLLGAEFEDSEFRVPYDRWKNAGNRIDIVGAKTGEELNGKKGQEKVRADRAIDDVSPDDYDALFIPGGYSPDHLRADPRFVNFVKRFDASGKPILAICHGAQLFLSAGIVKGRTLTAWKTVQDDLRAAGANVRDQPVVQDRNWVTSRNPGDLDAFSQAGLDYLRQEAGAGAPA
jgi:protease I